VRLLRACAVVLLSAVLVTSCSDAKKVGSGIDVESLDEKASRLGKLDVPKKGGDAGFVGEKEREQEQEAEQQAEQQGQTEADVKKAEQANASVAFSITAQGYDPYYIRVFEGGIVSATNRDNAERTVTSVGEFDSGPIAPGETWTYTANKVGKFNFSDATRPFVVGTLEVLAR
jgi:hypothetical protein